MHYGIASFSWQEMIRKTCGGRCETSKISLYDAALGSLNFEQRDSSPDPEQTKYAHTHILSLTAVCNCFSLSVTHFLTSRSGTKSLRSTERAPGTWPTAEPSSWSSLEAGAFVSSWRGVQGRSQSTVSIGTSVQSSFLCLQDHFLTLF